MEEKKESAVELPAYPLGIFEWNDDDRKFLQYTGEQSDIASRMSHKLWNCWLVWNFIRNDQKLIDMISESSEKDTDEFYIRNSIVFVIDRLGKILGNTDIGEEILKTNQKISPKE